MTNFDFLNATPDFDIFSDAAISAGEILHVDKGLCNAFAIGDIKKFRSLNIMIIE